MNEQVDEGLATGIRGEDTVGELCPMTAVGTLGSALGPLRDEQACFTSASL